MDLTTVNVQIDGNLAKVEVLTNLFYLLENTDNNLRILDVGVGPYLNFWKPLLETNRNFELYGIDIAGIEKAKEEFKDYKNVKLMQLSGYFLSEKFGPNFFDVIVSTQVLEHVFMLKKFIDQIYQTAKINGHIFLTLDSAHYSYRSANAKLIMKAKQLIMKILASIGYEDHYNVPIYDYELEQLFHLNNLKIIDKRFYNIDPLKAIHNHKISLHRKNEFLMNWYLLENLLNEEKNFIAENKNYFMGLYYHLQKL